VAAILVFGAFISQAAGPKSSSTTGLTAVIFGANLLFGFFLKWLFLL